MSGKLAGAAFDFMDELEVHSAEVVPADAPEPVLKRELLKEEIVHAELRELENEILAKCVTIVNDVMHMRDIDPTQESLEIPEEWRDALSPDDQVKRMRIAKAAWLNKREAPVGFEVATKIMSSIVRARSVEKAGPRSLNVALVQLSVAPNQYPELDVTSEK